MSKGKQQMKFGKLVSTTIVLFISSSIHVAFAQDFYWACGNGNWSSGSCWSGVQGGTGGAGVPGVSDDAFIFNTSPADVTVTYNSNLYPISRLNSYVLDANNTGNLSMTLQDEQILKAVYETVGNNGTASVIQKSGDNYSSYLELAKTQTSNGSYYLNGGNLYTSSTYVAGGGRELSGTGSFVQSNGNHQTGSLWVGDISSGGFNRANYELSAGTLSTTWSYVMSGNSVFNQSGGIHNASQNIRTNNNFYGGAATYNLSGGILSTREFLNGGVFNYTGGDLQTSVGFRNENGGTFILNKGAGEIHEFDGYFLNRDRAIFEVTTEETAVFNGQVSGSGNFTGDGTKVFRDEYRPGYVYIPPEPNPDDPFPLPEEPIRYSLANGPAFTGDTIFEETSMISLFLLGDGQSDWLNFSGPVDLNGTLNLSLGLDEYMPILGDSWDIIFGTDINGSFSNIVSDAPGNWGWEILYLDDRVTLTTTNLSSVPIPAGVWLFGSGLIGLVGFARRKKA